MILLEKMNTKGAKEGFFSEKAKSDCDDGFVEVKHRKKKKEQQMEIDDQQPSTISESNLNNPDLFKTKREKKRDKKLENSLVSSMEDQIKIKDKSSIMSLKDVGKIHKKSKKDKKNKVTGEKMFEELSNEELCTLIGEYLPEKKHSKLSKKEQKRRDRELQKKRMRGGTEKPKVKTDSGDDSDSEMDVIEKLDLTRSKHEEKQWRKNRTRFEEEHRNKAPQHSEEAMEKAPSKKKKKGYIRDLAEKLEATKV